MWTICCNFITLFDWYLLEYYFVELLHRNDEELNKLFSHVTIAQGGVLPNIHAVLLPKRTAVKAAAGGSDKKKVLEVDEEEE